MFLGRVTLDDWLERCLVAVAAVDWLAVRWLAEEGDWLEVRWVVGEGDWLEVRWVVGEGDWLEVRWVAGAELGSSWSKVLVSSSFWVDKM